MMPSAVVTRKLRKRHAHQRRQQVGHEERHHRHQPHQQQHADLVRAQPVLEPCASGPRRHRAAPPATPPSPKRAARKMSAAPDRGADHVEERCPAQQPEQEAARDRGHRGPGQRKRDDDHVEPDEGQRQHARNGIRAKAISASRLLAQRVEARGSRRSVNAPDRATSRIATSGRLRGQPAAGGSGVGHRSSGLLCSARLPPNMRLPANADSPFTRG